MKYDSEFERLSKNLDEEERKELLEKLKKEKKTFNEEDFKPEKTGSEYQRQIKIAVNTYKGFGFFTKFIIWIIMIFYGRKKEEVVLDRMFNDIKREIQFINNNIIDFKTNSFTNNFVEEILNLAEACNNCLPIIEGYFEDTIYYQNFICEIIEENFTEELKNLLDNINPEKLEIKANIIEEDEFNNEKEKRIRKFFNQLSLTSFNKINLMFENFEVMIKLITFNFKTLLFDFTNENNELSSSAKYGAKYSTVGELLEKLYIIMNSIDFIYDDINFIEKMIDYSNKNPINKNIENLTLIDKIDELMRKIFHKIDSIKNKIPFKLIFQYFKRDLLYKTPVLNLSLDSIQIYKNFKRNIFNSQWEKYYSKIRDKNQEKLLNELFKDYKFDNLKNFTLQLKETVDSHSYIKLGFVKKLNLLSNFIEKIYKKEIEKIVNKILIEGNFLKDHFRNNISSSYYHLFNSLEAINQFDNKLDSERDLGKKLNTFIKISIAGDIDYTQSLQNTVIDINNISHEIIDGIYNSLWNINSIINNLLDERESNEILTNLDLIKIPGFLSAKSFLEKIKKKFDLFFKVYNLLEEY